MRMDEGGHSVPVTRTSTDSIYRDSHQFTKKTFPISLAYAMTAHKAQGATLTGRVVLHVRNAFEPGIVYVMLSRATTRDNVFILGGLNPRDVAPVLRAPFWQDLQGNGAAAAAADGSGDEDEDDAANGGSEGSADEDGGGAAAGLSDRE